MSDRLFVYMVFLAGMATGCACMATIAGKPTAPPAPSSTAIAVTPADTAAAKEVCRRHHLTWAALTLSEDAAHIAITCESEDIVRAQVVQCAGLQHIGRSK